MGNFLLGGFDIFEKLLTNISEGDIVITTYDISEHDITWADISENDNRGDNMSKILWELFKKTGNIKYYNLLMKLKNNK